jgi:hypothetical protein
MKNQEHTQFFKKNEEDLKKHVKKQWILDKTYIIVLSYVFSIFIPIAVIMSVVYFQGNRKKRAIIVLCIAVIAYFVMTYLTPIVDGLNEIFKPQ